MARRPLGDEFAEDMREGIVNFGSVDASDPKLDQFVKKISYFPLNFDDPASYTGLKAELDRVAAAVATHRVDGAMIAEPFLEAAKSQVKFVAPVDDAVAPRFMSTGWIATDAWIKAHPVEAAKFAEIMRQTAVWANAHQKESAQILLHHTRITAETAATMSRVTYATTLDPKLLQPSIDAAAKYATTPMRVTPATELIWRP